MRHRRGWGALSAFALAAGALFYVSAMGLPGWLTGTSASPSEPAADVPAPQDVRYPIQARFDCGDIAVEASFDRDSVRLRLPDRALTLPQTVSGSGARYAEGRTLFWNKGRVATFELDGVTRLCDASESK